MNDRHQTPGYDVIGDVHGSAEKLEGLLQKLGYVETNGVYRHDVRTAVFVGDLIDRGPSQLRVLEVVRAMVEQRSALAVMGNHELNALGYATPDPDLPGEFCRPHKASNHRQHQQFLDQLTAAERANYLRWFQTLPLWLDLGDLRVVHACWHEPARAYVERELGGSTFTSLEQVVRATRRGEVRDELFIAAETLLKGPEVDLRDFGLPDYLDADGKARHEARLSWWVEGEGALTDLVEVPDDWSDAGEAYNAVAEIRLTTSDVVTVGGDTPVIYGHYWRKWDPQGTGYRDWRPVRGADWSDMTACVDFAAVKNGPLVAYQWCTGDTVIDAANFIAYR